jgi:catecholate siderophore receptor
VDSRTASTTAPFDPVTGLVKQIPGYWVFNAMASRPINDHVSFQVNLYNLANRYYYDEPHPAHIVPGAGFTALSGFNFRF